MTAYPARWPGLGFPVRCRGTIYFSMRSPTNMTANTKENKIPSIDSDELRVFERLKTRTKNTKDKIKNTNDKNFNSNTPFFGMTGVK